MTVLINPTSDPFAGLYPSAKAGQWIKDLSPQKRGLGLVKEVLEDTYGMKVFLIRSRQTTWTI